jgi:uncharacterized membrane protein (DUF2068 family)
LNTHSSGALRSVALLEAAKGSVVLLAGAGALSFIHHDAQHFAERVVRHLHLDPANDTPRIFLEFATRATDSRLAMLAAFAAAYSLVRFVEAFGLWKEMRWAEWFAAVSGGLYIPFEIFNLFHGHLWLSLSALVINVAVVAVMVKALYRGRRAAALSGHAK